jgi:hypothetical protein
MRVVSVLSLLTVIFYISQHKDADGDASSNTARCSSR